MAKRIGEYTISLDSCPSILGYASVVSKKEGQGPLGKYFDVLCDDSSFGEQTWEKAESRMQKDAVNKALEKAVLSTKDIDCIFAGDLLNQCISSSYGLRDLGIPFLGVYGACSTMAESLGLASVFVDTNAADKALAVTSSHFCSAERQFRFPLEYGSMRPPTAQWTVTGSGSCVIGKSQDGPYVKSVCFGTIEDMGIKDINNMGAAMAPAAAKTITNFFNDTKTDASNYDKIFTGDLGYVGTRLLYELMDEQHYDIREKHSDCGLMIYDMHDGDVNAGGSGCGCGASVLCGYILNEIENGHFNNVLFIATGALMSTTSIQQGESIPAVAHLIHISSQKN